MQVQNPLSLGSPALYENCTYVYGARAGGFRCQRMTAVMTVPVKTQNGRRVVGQK